MLRTSMEGLTDLQLLPAHKTSQDTKGVKRIKSVILELVNRFDASQSFKTWCTHIYIENKIQPRKPSTEVDIFQFFFIVYNFFMFFLGTFFLMGCCFPFERVHFDHFFPKKLVTTSENSSRLPFWKRCFSRFFEWFRIKFFPGVVPRPVTAKCASTAQLQAVLHLTSRDVKLTLHHFDIYLSSHLVFFLVSSCLFFLVSVLTVLTVLTVYVVCSHVFILPTGVRILTVYNVGRKVVVQTWRRWKWFCICISIWTHSCRKTWNQIMAWWCMQETHERDEMMMWKR